MATLQSIIGFHAFIALEGATVTNSGGSETISSTIFPDGTTAADWQSLGCTVTNDFQHNFNNPTERFCPSPGTYKKAGTKYGNTSTVMTLTLDDMTDNLWELVFATSSLDGSNVGTPGSQGQPKKGWLKVQKYESGTENNVANIMSWCELIVPNSTQFSSSVTQPQLQCDIIDNALNSIQFLNGAITGA